MKIRYYLFALAAAFMVSCSEEKLDEKIIFTDSAEANVSEFDKWLQVNYQEPYNILLKYRFEFKESDNSKEKSVNDRVAGFGIGWTKVQVLISFFFIFLTC